MRGVVASGNVTAEKLVEQARAIARMEGADLVRDVTCAAAYEWRAEGDEAPEAFWCRLSAGPGAGCGSPPTIFGIKRNILRRLAAHNCDVHVFPANDAGRGSPRPSSRTASF